MWNSLWEKGFFGRSDTPASSRAVEPPDASYWQKHEEVDVRGGIVEDSAQKFQESQEQCNRVPDPKTLKVEVSPVKEEETPESERREGSEC